MIEGVPPRGANERELRKAWDQAHSDKYEAGPNASPEDIENADMRLHSAMRRTKELWRSIVDEHGSTFTQKQLQIEAAYERVKEAVLAGLVTLPPTAGVMLAASAEDGAQGVVAGTATGVVLATVLGLAKAVKEGRKYSLSTGTKEAI